MSSLRIAPSILSADFGRLALEVEAVERAGADWIHVDVMDGRFVPNITLGPVIVKAVRAASRLPVDVHLMIVEPEKYVGQFVDAGADVVTVHAEASPHLDRTLSHIRKLGAKAGVALNPHSPEESLRYVLEEADLFLVMSVNPGFGGQKFIENTYDKVSRLKDMILQKSSKAIIEIDGGVNIQNAPKIKQAGADALVAGNFVFSSSSPLEVIAELKNI